MLYDSDKPLYEIQMNNANVSCGDMHKAARILKISVDAIIDRELYKPDDLIELADLLKEEALQLVKDMREYAYDQNELNNLIEYIEERNTNEMGV